MGPSSTIRQGDWKLIYYHSDQRFELFDLSSDIGETRNLVKDHAARAKALARELGRYLRDASAPMPRTRVQKIPVPCDDVYE